MSDLVVTDTQKVDLLFKKSFGLARTGEFLTFGETETTPPQYRGDNVWLEAHLIPKVPAAVTDVVVAHDLGKSTYGWFVPVETISTLADTSGVYRTYQAATRAEPRGAKFLLDSEKLRTWIGPDFGMTYFVNIWVDNPGGLTSSAVQLFANGTSNAGPWVFDTSAGLLHFINNTRPPALTADKQLYITGYRYVGRKGIGYIMGLLSSVITTAPPTFPNAKNLALASNLTGGKTVRVTSGYTIPNNGNSITFAAGDGVTVYDNTASPALSYTSFAGESPAWSGNADGTLTWYADGAAKINLRLRQSTVANGVYDTYTDETGAVTPSSATTYAMTIANVNVFPPIVGTVYKVFSLASVAEKTKSGRTDGYHTNYLTFVPGDATSTFTSITTSYVLSSTLNITPTLGIGDSAAAVSAIAAASAGTLDAVYTTYNVVTLPSSPSDIVTIDGISYYKHTATFGLKYNLSNISGDYYCQGDGVYLKTDATGVFAETNTQNWGQIRGGTPGNPTLTRNDTTLYYGTHVLSMAIASGSPGTTAANNAKPTLQFSNGFKSVTKSFSDAPQWNEKTILSIVAPFTPLPNVARDDSREAPTEPLDTPSGKYVAKWFQNRYECIQSNMSLTYLPPGPDFSSHSDYQYYEHAFPALNYTYARLELVGTNIDFTAPSFALRVEIAGSSTKQWFDAMKPTSETDGIQYSRDGAVFILDFGSNKVANGGNAVRVKLAAGKYVTAVTVDPYGPSTFIVPRLYTPTLTLPTTTTKVGDFYYYLPNTVFEVKCNVSHLSGAEVGVTPTLTADATGVFQELSVTGWSNLSITGLAGSAPSTYNANEYVITVPVRAVNANVRSDVKPKVTFYNGFKSSLELDTASIVTWSGKKLLVTTATTAPANLAIDSADAKPALPAVASAGISNVAKYFLGAFRCLRGASADFTTGYLPGGGPNYSTHATIQYYEVDANISSTSVKVTIAGSGEYTSVYARVKSVSYGINTAENIWLDPKITSDPFAAFSSTSTGINGTGLTNGAGGVYYLTFRTLPVNTLSLRIGLTETQYVTDVVFDNTWSPPA